MGNLEFGPREWPIVWVVIKQVDPFKPSKAFSAVGIYTSKEAAFHEAGRLVEQEFSEDIRKVGAEGYDEGMFHALSNAVERFHERGDPRDLLDLWSELTGDHADYYIAKVAANVEVDPDEWFNVEHYPGAMRRPDISRKLGLI